MKLGKKRGGLSEIEIPTASLADIVFLLLIFFLVTTSMNPAKGLGLTLPPPGEQVKIASKNVLNVYINAKGKVLIKEEVVPVEDVEEVVKEQLKENPKLVISLQTDLEAKYEDMINVLDQLKLAEAKRISLAVPQL